MEFAYKVNGEVTGYGRKGIIEKGELTGNCTPQDWSAEPQEYNKDVRCYTGFNGILTAKDQSKIDSIIRDDSEENALMYLETCYNNKIIDAGFETFTISTSAAINRKGGSAKPKDEKILDDLDIIDDWYDELEKNMEVGEAWIESPMRTVQELVAFDPCIDVFWTEPPVPQD